MRERGREETEALGWVKKLLTDFFFCGNSFYAKNTQILCWNKNYMRKNIKIIFISGNLLSFAELLLQIQSIYYKWC